MKKRQNIALLYGISFLQGMIFYGPIATLYRQAAGVSVLQITMIESISLALCVLLELPWGMLADRIGYKTTMLLCCGLYWVSKIVFWQAEDFAGFLLERVMISVVIAGISGVDVSILYLSCLDTDGAKASGAGNLDATRTQSVFGINNNMNIAGLSFASGVYALLIRDDYRLAGFLTVLSYGAAALLALCLVEVRPPVPRARQRRFVRKDSAPQGSAPQNTSISARGETPRIGSRVGEFAAVLRQLLQNRRLLLLLVAVALLSESHQTITVFLSQLQYVKCGMTSAQIGAAYVLIDVAGLLGGLSARATHRLGALRLGGLLFLCCAAACGTLALTGSALLSVVAILVLHVAFSLFEPLQTELRNQQIETENRATALSLHAVLINCVGIFTNVMFGSVAQWNLAAAMVLGMCFCLVGLLLFGVAQRRRPVA